jgi:hypothetical protein
LAATVLRVITPAVCARDGGVAHAAARQAKQYSTMSDEEKAVMGYDGAFVNRIAQNYRTLTSLQGTLGSTPSTGGGILSYL